MGRESDLLRMLEPVVRPGNPGSLALRGPRVPIESQSFESLLDEARGAQGAQQAAVDEGRNDAGSTRRTDPARTVVELRSLAQVDRIENASLRGLIGNAER